MCDTLVATANATAARVTIFAKNSDRDPNEAHHLLFVPAARHAPGETLHCTYIAIPQVHETHAVLLTKPFWIWGAEMGVNEHGVTIGNEAIFSKVPAQKKEALLGMDLVRLGLERAATARQAVSVMIELLERYGQGGNCGFQHKLYYHNSFLVADPTSAYLLETVSRQWASRQVEGIYTISNSLTLNTDWDAASSELVSQAILKGWCRSSADFHLASSYSDYLYTTYSDARSRQARSLELLGAQQGNLALPSIIGVLRDHGPKSSSVSWSPAKGLTGATLCLHASYGPVRGTQTTGSLVVYLQPGRPLLLATGTAAPCTSVFKPLWLDTPLPPTGPPPTGVYDPATLFWQHEALHRATLRDFPVRLPLYQAERDQLEAGFIAGALARQSADAAERAAFSAACFAQAAAAEAEWLRRVQSSPEPAIRDPLYQRAWNNNNKAAQMP